MGCKGCAEDGWCIYQEIDKCENCLYYYMEDKNDRNIQRR